MNSYILFKRGILVALVAIFFAGGVGMFDSVESADLSSVKVELSTPRLSFHGLLAAGHTSGETTVTIKNTGPSTSTANLFVGEQVTIGVDTPTVIDADDGLTFQIQPGLNTITEDTDIFVARETDMTVTFTPISIISDGKFVVKVPASASDSNDGNPDQDGWDTNVGAAEATCPDATTVSATTAGGYHTFECSYTGNNTTAEKTITVAGLINPSPAGDHTIGDADQYRVVVQHSDGTDVIDQSSAAVALIEAVRITASVAPSIELQLLGFTGPSACGESISEDTTPTQVPLGELSITNFTTAAQQIKVSTNAQNGYVVTAIAEDQLRRQHVAACTGDGDTVSGCIPDSEGDTTTMAADTSDQWTNTATKGFAYTLEYVGLISGGLPTMAFEHDEGTDQYRQFADEEDGETPEILFESSSVADSHLVNVCYKAVIGATQEAGEDYATNVTYRATATF